MPNAARSKECARNWYLKNRERIRAQRLERAKAWNAANPERVKQNARLRRAKETNSQPRQTTAKTREKGRERLVRWRVKYPWYDSWQAARQRCTNPKNPAFNRYGGKGITFNLSKADMIFLWARDNGSALTRPSLDRRDNTKGYCLENCAFIELSANSRKIAFDKAVKEAKEVIEMEKGREKPSRHALADLLFA